MPGVQNQILGVHAIKMPCHPAKAFYLVTWRVQRIIVVERPLWQGWNWATGGVRVPWFSWWWAGICPRCRWPVLLGNDVVHWGSPTSRWLWKRGNTRNNSECSKHQAPKNWIWKGYFSGSLAPSAPKMQEYDDGGHWDRMMSPKAREAGEVERISAKVAQIQI